MFNPKYKILGMLSTPFWFFFEWLAPLIEFTGVLFFLFLLVIGQINWQVFLTLFLAVYSFAILFSVTALFFEEYSFQQYKKPSYILRLIGTAILEPLIYHPVIMWSAVMGNLDLLRGRKSWGVMTRAGISKPKKKP